MYHTTGWQDRYRHSSPRWWLIPIIINYILRWQLTISGDIRVSSKFHVVIFIFVWVSRRETHSESSIISTTARRRRRTTTTTKDQIEQTDRDTQPPDHKSMQCFFYVYIYIFLHTINHTTNCRRNDHYKTKQSMIVKSIHYCCCTAHDHFEMGCMYYIPQAHYTLYYIMYNLCYK